MTRRAARVLDTHTCPATSPWPHVGGFVKAPGVTSVRIGHRPAAQLGTGCICVAANDNTIVAGSSSVKIGHRPAARQGDATAHGGRITSGCESVRIGG